MNLICYLSLCICQINNDLFRKNSLALFISVSYGIFYFDLN